MEQLNTRSLTSTSLMVLFNQLNLEEQLKVAQMINKQRRVAEMLNMGLKDDVAAFLSQDDWVNKETQAATQDVLFKNHRRLSALCKRAKYQLIMRTPMGKTSVMIICYEPSEDEEDAEHQDAFEIFNLQQLQDLQISVFRFFIKHTPNTEPECFVVSEL